MSRIDSITVEVLRQHESFTNDKLTIHVADIHPGEDLVALEAGIRDQAVKQIEDHWTRREKADQKKFSDDDIPF